MVPTLYLFCHPSSNWSHKLTNLVYRSLQLLISHPYLPPASSYPDIYTPPRTTRTPHHGKPAILYLSSCRAFSFFVYLSLSLSKIPELPHYACAAGDVKSRPVIPLPVCEVGDFFVRSSRSLIAASSRASGGRAPGQGRQAGRRIAGGWVV